MKKGKIVLLSGPSGVGKGTVINELLSDKSLNLMFSISMTTRAPRPGEVNGREYFFVTREEFDAQLAANNFLEHATFVGNSYGTPKDYVYRLLEEGKNVFIEIEVEGAKSLLEKVDPSDVISIYLMPPSVEELGKRLRGRQTESEEKILDRLARYESEITFKNQYEFHVINDGLEKCIAEIKALIKARI